MVWKEKRLEGKEQRASVARYFSKDLRSSLKQRNCSSPVPIQAGLACFFSPCPFRVLPIVGPLLSRCLPYVACPRWPSVLVRYHKDLLLGRNRQLDTSQVSRRTRELPRAGRIHAPHRRRLEVTWSTNIAVGQCKRVPYKDIDSHNALFR